MGEGQGDRDRRNTRTKLTDRKSSQWNPEHRQSRLCTIAFEAKGAGQTLSPGQGACFVGIEALSVRFGHYGAMAGRFRGQWSSLKQTVHLPNM